MRSLALLVPLALATTALAEDTPSFRSPHSSVAADEVVVFQLRKDFRIPLVKGTRVEGLSQRDHALLAAAMAELVQDDGVRPQAVDAAADQMHDRFPSPAGGSDYGLVGSVHLDVLEKDDGQTILGGLSHLATVHVYLYSRGERRAQRGFFGTSFETEFDRDENSAPISAAWFADVHSADALRYVRGLRDGRLLWMPASDPSAWAVLDADPKDPAPALAAAPFGLPTS